MTDFDKVASGEPVDRVARWVTGPGERPPTESLAPGERETPWPTREWHDDGDNDLTGMRLGLLVVVGYADDPGCREIQGMPPREHRAKTPTTGSLWVTKCDCGLYGLRRSRKMKNAAWDACSRCRAKGIGPDGDGPGLTLSVAKDGPHDVGFAVAVIGEDAIEITVEITKHARDRAMSRLRIDLGLDDVADAYPTTRVRDGLRQWKFGNGATLMMRESAGTGWAMLTVVTVLSRAQADNPPRSRPYTSSPPPTWAHDLRDGLQRGRLIRILGEQPRMTIDEIAVKTGAKPTKLLHHAGELARAGWLAKHKRRNSQPAWRVKRLATAALGRAVNLPPAIHDVDSLRRLLAEKSMALTDAKAHDVKSKAKIETLKRKNQGLWTRIGAVTEERDGDW